MILATARKHRAGLRRALGIHQHTEHLHCDRLQHNFSGAYLQLGTRRGEASIAAAVSAWKSRTRSQARPA
jgi:hypothetical protein